RPPCSTPFPYTPLFRSGVFENEYRREDGKWKIAVHRFHPQYEGPYESGWNNYQGRDLAILPYHFSPDESGIPIPAPLGEAPPAKDRKSTRLNSSHVKIS